MSNTGNNKPNDSAEKTNATSPLPSSSSSSLSSSSSFLSSLPIYRWWVDLHDEQRLQRLQQCRELEKALHSCRQRRQNQVSNLANKKSERQKKKVNEGQPKLAAMSLEDMMKDYNEIEQTGIGLRMMKYFGWRGIVNGSMGDSDNDTNDLLNNRQSRQVMESCAREKHALWACRGVSVGCGHELTEVKNCFLSEGPASVLLQPNTSYESDSNGTSPTNTSSIPCDIFQRQLGNCVVQGANELLEREQLRNKRNTRNRKG